MWVCACLWKTLTLAITFKRYICNRLCTLVCILTTQTLSNGTQDSDLDRDLYSEDSHFTAVAARGIHVSHFVCTRNKFAIVNTYNKICYDYFLKTSFLVYVGYLFLI